MTVEVLHADCRDALARMADEGRLFDAIVTDPPAGISFMGREWDSDKGGRDEWIAWMQSVAAGCLAVMKPGAHALVWALPRTSHWTATAWENAGWQVRDRVAFLFGTGFPKNTNISKMIDKAAGPDTDAARQWDGWGTALKPAAEDWWLLRKPLSEPTIAANVLAHGTGPINVDACRVASATPVQSGAGKPGFGAGRDDAYEAGTGRIYGNTAGRFPANLIHDGSDEVLAAFAAFGERKSTETNARGKSYASDVESEGVLFGHRKQGQLYSDTGTAARFFQSCQPDAETLRFHYSSKANKRERDGSRHPTVKPQSLLRYLARLITPPGGTILDPFAGSGSLAPASHAEGFNAVLIEREAEHYADCLRRVDAIKHDLLAAD